jgi:general secretion pathway protein C
MRASLRLPSLDLSRVLVACLGTAIGLQVAWMVTGAFGARENLVLPSAPTMAVAPLETLKAARLFGTPTLSGGEALTVAPPISTQGLTLVGVLAAADPKAGQAIIGEAGAAARVYTVGGTLPGGSRLAEVYPDRVILDRGGSFETLPLPRQGGTPAVSGATPASAALAPAAAPSLAPGEAIATNDITNVIRWQAVIRTDKPSGVRVYPGDLVPAVNNTPLADQANGEQFLRSLAGTPQAQLTVERGGRTETLLVDLTQIGTAR